MSFTFKSPSQRLHDEMKVHNVAGENFYAQTRYAPVSQAQFNPTKVTTPTVASTAKA